MREIARPGLFIVGQEARRHEGKSSGNLGGRLGKVFGWGKTEKSPGKEEVEISRIRPVEPRDYLRILRWIEDRDTQGHISPLPKVPEDWNNEELVIEATHELGQYYTNKGEPEKITPLAAVNQKDRPLGIVTIRWRGDPWAPKGHRVAMIERLAVNPNIRGRGIGTKLVEEALRLIFEERGYPEARAWVMSDDLARGWGRVIEFFHKLGFDQLLDEQDRSWKKYQEARGMTPDGRDAKQLVLKREDWERRKKDKEPVQPELIPFKDQTSTT